MDDTGFDVIDDPADFFYKLEIQRGEFRSYISIQAPNDQMARTMAGQLAEGLALARYKLVRRTQVLVKDIFDYPSDA